MTEAGVFTLSEMTTFGEGQASVSEQPNGRSSEKELSNVVCGFACDEFLTVVMFGLEACI